MTKRFRYSVLLSVLTLLRCSRAGVEQPELPRSISPGWRLLRVESMDISTSPRQVREARPENAWIATYSGDSIAHVRIWAIPRPLGLELVQRWRAEANTVVFYSQHYFAAIDWKEPDAQKASALVRAVERALGLEYEP